MERTNNTRRYKLPKYICPQSRLYSRFSKNLRIFAQANRHRSACQCRKLQHPNSARYHRPQTTEEWRQLKDGDSPHVAGDDTIEAHHRNQKPVRDGGVLDELAKGSHRGTGIHGKRHTKPSKLTNEQRTKEIKNHYENRAKDYKDSDFDDCGNIKPGVAERVNKKYGVK